MSTPFSLAADKPRTALVIAFPPGMKGLFNPEIHSLVRDVSERLDGVFVTYALAAGCGPDLRDAMASARFMGCDSAVVIPAGSDQTTQSSDAASGGDWMLSTATLPSELTAPAVAEAFLTAVEGAERAA